MEHLEIERKYTVKCLPDNLQNYPCNHIEQAYLNTAPVIRIRKSNNTYTLTYKGSGLMAREEYNLPLDEVSYKHLKQKSDGNIISKKRYLIPLANPQFNDTDCPITSSGLTIELDIFDPPFAPLIIAEVEFDNINMANAFVPPEWFDEDVTENPAYHNVTLCQKKLTAVN